MAARGVIVQIQEHRAHLNSGIQLEISRQCGRSFLSLPIPLLLSSSCPSFHINIVRTWGDFFTSLLPLAPSPAPSHWFLMPNVTAVSPTLHTTTPPAAPHTTLHKVSHPLHSTLSLTFSRGVVSPTLQLGQTDAAAVALGLLSWGSDLLARLLNWGPCKMCIQCIQYSVLCTVYVCNV